MLCGQCSSAGRINAEWSRPCVESLRFCRNERRTSLHYAGVLGTFYCGVQYGRLCLVSTASGQDARTCDVPAMLLKHPAEGTLRPSICAWVRLVQRPLACLRGILFSFASACVTASGWDASTHEGITASGRDARTLDGFGLWLGLVWRLSGFAVQGLPALRA